MIVLDRDYFYTFYSIMLKFPLESFSVLIEFVEHLLRFFLMLNLHKDFLFVVQFANQDCDIGEQKHQYL